MYNWHAIKSIINSKHNSPSNKNSLPDASSNLEAQTYLIDTHVTPEEKHIGPATACGHHTCFHSDLAEHDTVVTNAGGEQLPYQSKRIVHSLEKYA